MSSFRALAASSADALQVPDGYRADVVIAWGDPFEDDAGTRLRYGFNNDFLALRLSRERKLPAPLTVRAVDRAGNASERTKAMRFE